MTLNQFITYMESLITTKDTFYLKLTENETNQNLNRLSAQQWNETVIERAVDKHWVEFMTNIYNQVEMKVRLTDPVDKGWVDFITAEGFINSLDESIHEMEVS